MRARTQEARMSSTIDETIERVEQLYTAVTGSPPPTPNGHRSAFPPEIDPGMHVEEQLARMVMEVERLVPQARSATWIPHAVIWHEGADLVLAIDVPGVSREHVHVRVEHHALVINGLRRAPWSHQPSNLVGCDAPLGAFARSFALSAPISADQISGRIDNGVLTIRIHSSTRPQASQITIMS
jgi:HSP20 family molecular chaperone IbpA